MSEKIDAFLGYIDEQIRDRAPYIWQGKADKLWTPEGLKRHAFGCHVFDCSGLIACALLAAGGRDIRATHNADAMWREFEPTEKPQPGDLVFYGSFGKATHVEAVLKSGEYAGALNGGPHTVVANPEAARVRIRVRDRQDRLGFRRNPLRD